MGIGGLFGKKEKTKGKAKNSSQSGKKKSVKKKPAKKKEKKQVKKQAAEEIDTDKWPLRVISIVEILGAPKEHVTETMNFYLEKLKKEKNVKVINVEKSDVEQKEKLFSMFAEVEMLFKENSHIVDFCFAYMPSSIEVLEPETIKFNAHSFSNFFNDLQGRLHKLDMLVKNLTAENKILQQNSSYILRNNILLSLKEKDKDLTTISKNIGIPEEKTKAFLDALVKQGFINLEKNKYSLNREKVNFSE